MLALDVREACSPRRTGKGQWTFGLVSALLRRAVPLTLLTDADIPAAWLALLRPDHRVVRIAARGLRWHLRARRHLRALSGATYLSTTSYLLPAIGVPGVRTATVVHDLIAFRPEPHEPRARMIERCTLPLAVRHSWKICSLSEATTSDLRRRFPGVPMDICAVGAGPGDGGKAWRPPGKHVFCLATLCPRKNQGRLVEAYAALPDDLRRRFPLLLAGGRGWHDREILQRVDRTEGASWLGYVSQDEAVRLLADAAVFAYPSLYEGFGLPVLDALHAGVPVLTTAGGSLAEVAGDAAVVVNPLDVHEIAAGLQRLLTDDGLRSQCSLRATTQAAAYSWERTADAVLRHLTIDNIA